MSYSAVPIVDCDNSPSPMDNAKVYDSQSLTKETRLSTTELIESGHTSYADSPLPHKSSFIQFAHDHKVREFTSHGRKSRILRNIWLTAWLPMVSFTYLGFYYAAATQVVPVRVYKVDQPLEHLYGIKAGVTTLSIIVIAIARLPAKSVIDDLKTEEFFRRLRKSKGGVPLDIINDVSTPSHGFLQGFASVFRSDASRYFATAIFSSLLVVIVSSLAPATLSVGVIPVESEITALRAGALAPDSIYVTSTAAYASLNSGSNGKKYAVYRRPNDAPVDLQGVADLPQLKAAGAVFGFGG